MAIHKRTCTFDGCGQPHLALGYCSGHYLQHWRGKVLTPLRTTPVRTECEFAGCSNSHLALGYCTGHYQQHRRGDELRPLRDSLSPQDRLDDLTGKTDGCWFWTGYVNPEGYGCVSIGGRVVLAHRLAYELAYGALPSAALVDHKCRVKHCIRPDHLQPATRMMNAENRDGANRNSLSGVRGVYWHAWAGKWATQVGHAGHRVSAGYYHSIAEAESAVVALRRELQLNSLADR